MNDAINKNIRLTVLTFLMRHTVSTKEKSLWVQRWEACI